MAWIILIAAVVILWAYLKSRKPHVDLSHLPEIFVVLDLETSGLKAHKDEIIEIGAIRAHRDAKQHDTFQIFVRPTKQISNEITAKTGITNQILDTQGIQEAIALREFLEFIGDYRLVTFNAEFDMGFLHAAALRHGLVISNPVSCALKMARRAWPGRKSYRLVDLAKDGGLNTRGAHRALQDCKLASIVYTAAANQLRTID